MATSQATVGQDAPKCTICWETFSSRATLMPCGHTFDFECILPWFQSVVQASRRGIILPCPICQQHAKFIRHSYTPSGRFSTMDLIMYFTRNRWRSQADLHQRYRGPLRDLILVGTTEDRLGIHRIKTMGPNQTEALVAFLREQQAQVTRLNKQDLRILVDMRERFIGLLGDPASHARDRSSQVISSFPGFTQQDTLDWDAINRMSRKELAVLRNVIGRSCWTTFEDRQRLYRRSFELENPAQRRDR